jgi:hypothetical protein
VIGIEEEKDVDDSFEEVEELELGAPSATYKAPPETTRMMTRTTAITERATALLLRITNRVQNCLFKLAWN